MSVRSLVALSVGTCVLVALPLSAAMAGRAAGPPRVVLHAGGHAQRGGLAWEEWTSGDGQHCVTASGDGPGTFPRPARLSPGRHGPSFVLFRRQRPSDIEVTAWHKLDRRGYQTGPSEAPPHTLHPHRNAAGDVTAWLVRFDVNVPPPYYLHLYAAWPAGKCEGPRDLLRTYAITAR
jgi:hypothetical protein